MIAFIAVSVALLEAGSHHIRLGASPSVDRVEPSPNVEVFTLFFNHDGGYGFAHPKNWIPEISGNRSTFFDSHEGVTVHIKAADVPPTPMNALAVDVPLLKSVVPSFRLVSVDRAEGPPGEGVCIHYQRFSMASVLNRQSVWDDVQRFEFVHDGRQLVFEVFGPAGRIDPKLSDTMVDSLRWNEVKTALPDVETPGTRE